MNSSSPHGWAFRSFPVFCHDMQSRGACPSPQVILHIREETCRVSVQKWHSWIKGCAAFIFWLLLRAWSLWRVRWSRVQQPSVWGRACPGPLQGAVSTISACVKPNKATRESLNSKTCFTHIGFLQRHLPGWRNSFESLPSLVQKAEPGSSVSCGRPSIACFPVSPQTWALKQGARSLSPTCSDCPDSILLARKGF